MAETSIIIRAFNEEAHLPDLLDGIARQTYRDVEVVVVDSGSFDRTRELAEERADKLVRIDRHDFTFGHSLNVGIQNSEGPLIAIVSAHTLPVDECWLDRLVQPLRQEANAMVYGRQVGRADSKFGEATDFNRTFGPERRILKPPHFFANNANSAIRRSLWEKHPFDEALPGLEDVEWAKYWMERGLHIVYEPQANIYHIHNESWPQVRRRYHREALAAKWIGVRHRRHVPFEVLRETRNLVGDLLEATRRRQLLRRAPEIARFRFEKLTGAVSGIFDGAKLDNPLQRDRLFFDKSYQAVVIHGPGRATLSDVEMRPLTPGEVLVRVAYLGVCTTDIEILDGTLGYYSSGLAHYPIVPGHEFSGTVAAVGSRVSGVQEGDRVVVECIQGCGDCDACQRGNAIGCVERRELGVIGRDGAYAQHVVVPARFVHTLPAHVNLRDACLCEPLAVVMKGLRRLARAWDHWDGSRSCAVVGGGPLGHLAARMLSQRGHSVSVFDRNEDRLKYFSGSRIQTGQTLDDLEGFEAIVEATGDPDALATILEKCAAGATVLLLGLPYARRDFSFETIVGYDKTVVGSVGSTADDFREALRVLPSIDTSRFFEKVLPLSRFQQAWSLVRKQEHLKVVLEVA